jgi:hypothetical protein
MKIIFTDYSTGNKIGIYHEPVNIVIKPRCQKAKIIDGRQITEFRYFVHTIKESYDRKLDVLEYFVEVFVDASSRKILEEPI